MFSFKNFLKERYIQIPKQSPHYDKIMSDLSKLKGPVLLKGISPNRGNEPILASSMRDPSGDWFGIENEIPTFRKLAIKKLIHGKMGIKHPVFVTGEIYNAYDFGSNICVVIPRSLENLKAWFSPNVKDLLKDMFNEFSDSNISHLESASYYQKMEPDLYSVYLKRSEKIVEKFFNSYTKYNFLSSNPHKEIILDTKEYWLIPYEFFCDDIKFLRNLTYEQLFQLIK